MMRSDLDDQLSDDAWHRPHSAPPCYVRWGLCFIRCRLTVVDDVCLNLFYFLNYSGQYFTVGTLILLKTIPMVFTARGAA